MWKSHPVPGAGDEDYDKESTTPAAPSVPTKKKDEKKLSQQKLNIAIIKSSDVPRFRNDDLKCLLAKEFAERGETRMPDKEKEELMKQLKSALLAPKTGPPGAPRENQAASQARSFHANKLKIYILASHIIAPFPVRLLPLIFGNAKRETRQGPTFGRSWISRDHVISTIIKRATGKRLHSYRKQHLKAVSQFQGQRQRKQRVSYSVNPRKQTQKHIMGLLNRILLRNARRCFRIWFGSSHPQAIRRTSNVVVSPEKQQCWATAKTALTGLSDAFDLLDWINFALDLTFCIKLFYLTDSIFYAIVLMIGLILGRIVEFRGSYLLFASDNSNNSSSNNNKTSGSGGAGGIRWDPFWISPKYVRTSKKYRRVFPLLYCLVFTETAVFLLEDYPSLSIYAHWMVINLPPVPLETFDNVNVAFSTMMLCILLSLFIIAILSSIARLSWHSWNTREQCYNGVKICIFVVLWILLMRFIFDVLSRAVDVAIRDMPRLPSNEIMGIQICDPIVNFQDRHEFCDEESFAIHVAFAWLAAFYFSLYIFFRPLRLEDLDDDDDYSMDDDIINDNNAPQNSKSMPAIAATKGAAAVTATTISTGHFYAPPIRDESDDDNDTDPEMKTPIISNKKSPSNNNQEITIDATNINSPAVMDENKQQEATANTTTVEYHEDDSSANDGAVYMEMIDGTDPDRMQSHAEKAATIVAAAAEIDDPDIQSPAEMAATIVAAAMGPTPQQQLLQQSASASGDDDPLPLIVKSLTRASQQQQQQIPDYIVDNNEPGISTIE